LLIPFPLTLFLSESETADFDSTSSEDSSSDSSDEVFAGLATLPKEPWYKSQKVNLTGSIAEGSLESINKQYVLGEVLGKGTYGTVKIAQSRATHDM
jgi:hypothetical protein